MTRIILPGVGEADWVCTLCGETFDTQRAQEQHVGPCARSQMDEIHKVLEVRKRSIFDESQWNPDVAAYLREVGDRMVAEGRLEMRPNERIRNE